MDRTGGHGESDGWLRYGCRVKKFDRIFQKDREAMTPSRRGSAPSLQVIESCNSTWVFDAKAKRFRRVPKGTPLDLPTSAADWETYVKLEIDVDSDAFLVTLNEAGTRLLRSYKHSDPCAQCGPADATAELSLEAISRGA
jgi:hypothetical protein